MERERDDLHEAGPSQARRDKRVKIYKKLFFPTHIPNILEIKKVPIRVHAEEVRVSNEVLIIAGKGHENKQIYKDKIFNYDDIKIANYYINKKNQKYYAKLKNKN